MLLLFWKEKRAETQPAFRSPRCESVGEREAQNMTRRILHFENIDLRIRVKRTESPRTSDIYSRLAPAQKRI
jgi:hypothetical protein